MAVVAVVIILRLLGKRVENSFRWRRSVEEYLGYGFTKDIAWRVQHQPVHFLRGEMRIVYWVACLLST